MVVPDLQAEPQAIVRLASETDFAGWREAARRLRARLIAPEAAIWTVDGAGPLLDGTGEAAAPPALPVPPGFLDLSGPVLRARAGERCSLLYLLPRPPAGG